MAAANASLGDLRTWTHHVFDGTRGSINACTVRVQVVTFLIQMNPVHAVPSYVLRIMLTAFSYLRLRLKNACPAHLVTEVNTHLLNSTFSETVSRLRFWDLSALYILHNNARLLFSAAFRAGIPLPWYLKDIHNLQFPSQVRIKSVKVSFAYLIKQ